MHAHTNTKTYVKTLLIISNIFRLYLSVITTLYVKPKQRNFMVGRLLNIKTGKKYFSFVQAFYSNVPMQIN